MITFLADQNIEVIEQPMPAGNTADQKKLNQFSPLPLCADESFTGSESLEQIAALFDIINIKLMKTGSLVKSRQIIEEARKLNLQVMIGCMIESSIANTAAALLSLWADYADLDGHLLINDDPAAGLGLTTNKKIIMPDAPGLGVQMR
jgi:L-alanine-DL-glutamate epimerase-like enolase superfamily enzyme